MPRVRNKHAQARLREGGLDAREDLGKEGVAEIGHQHHCCAGAPAAQVLCGEIDAVAGAGRRFHDRLARVFGNRIRPIQGTADRRGRNARHAGHIGDLG